MADPRWHNAQNGHPRSNQFRLGNPGRPKATPPADTSPLAIAKRRGYAPFELLVDACEAMKAMLHDVKLTNSEQIKLIGIYVDTVLRSNEYVTPKLRAVEHSGQIDILQRLQNVSQCSDEELVKLLADADEYLAQHDGKHG